MGNESSKLAVQDRFDQLSRRPKIPNDDVIWTAMLSTSASNVELTDDEFFGMITVDDIRRICVHQPENFELLLLKTIERLQGLTRPGKVGTQGPMGPQISNCCRILTRLAPIIYERGSFPLEAGRIDRVLDLLKTLLHYPGYTTPLNPRPSPIWFPGMGYPVSDPDTSKYNKQRTEVLRTLLGVLGSVMYTESDDALDYFTATSNDPMLLSSLLNAALTSTDSKVSTLSLCLLTVSVVHMGQHKNQFRKLAAQIHRPEDLEWLGTHLKKLYESSFGSDRSLQASLMWEIAQANSNFASSNAVVGLAETLIKYVTDTRSERKVHADSAVASLQAELSKPRSLNELRLVTFALLTMTAQNTWAARAIGPQVLSIILAERRELAKPSIELATLVDVLWNCAPSLILTDQESQEYNEMREYLKASNQAVHAVIGSIYEVLLPRNPSLGLAGDKGGCSQWMPIQFQWEPARFRWYQGVLWGSAYQLEPRIWSHTAMKLFKVTEQKQTPAVEFLRTAASKLIS